MNKRSLFRKGCKGNSNFQSMCNPSFNKISMGSKICPLNPDSDVESNTDCSSCSDTAKDAIQHYTDFCTTIDMSLCKDEKWTDYCILKQMINQQQKLEVILDHHKTSNLAKSSAGPNEIYSLSDYFGCPVKLDQAHANYMMRDDDPNKVQILSQKNSRKKFRANYRSFAVVTTPTLSEPQHSINKVKSSHQKPSKLRKDTSTTTKSKISKSKGKLKDWKNMTKQLKLTKSGDFDHSQSFKGAKTPGSCTSYKYKHANNPFSSKAKTSKIASCLFNKFKDAGSVRHKTGKLKSSFNEQANQSMSKSYSALLGNKQSQGSKKPKVHPKFSKKLKLPEPNNHSSGLQHLAVGTQSKLVAEGEYYQNGSKTSRLAIPSAHSYYHFKMGFRKASACV